MSIPEQPITAALPADVRIVEVVLVDQPSSSRAVHLARALAADASLTSPMEAGVALCTSLSVTDKRLDVLHEIAAGVGFAQEARARRQALR